MEKRLRHYYTINSTGYLLTYLYNIHFKLNIGKLFA
jgi:hypothetical protein